MMKKRRNSLLAALFPNRCVYCDARVQGDALVCGECRNSLPRIEGEICPKCGRGKKVCACRKKENYYDGIAAPFYFEGNVRKGLHCFKFRNYTAGAEEYAREMYETIKTRFPDVVFDFITEVPVSAKSRRSRGYNQCELLAKEISALSGIPHRQGVIKKIYETNAQHGLPGYLRRGNLAGVFDLTEPETVKGKTVLLCDDISTSGETLGECSKMLWLYGAKSIYCITLALTKAEKREKK